MAQPDEVCLNGGEKENCRSTDAINVLCGFGLSSGESEESGRRQCDTVRSFFFFGLNF